LLDFWQFYFVSPRFVADPFAIELIEAEERVFDPGEASVGASSHQNHWISGM
jgi:hypothetical protein